jgi:hypothetical protein
MRTFGLDSSESRLGKIVGCSKYGNQLSGCVHCVGFLGHLRSSQLLKKVSASWR